MNPQVEKYVTSQEDWKNDFLQTLRKIIHKADPEIVEEWKWDVPVFAKKGMVCAISAFKDKVKINFFKGARLNDPHKLINAGLDSKHHRSIDFYQGDKIDAIGLEHLVKEAASLN